MAKIPDSEIRVLRMYRPELTRYAEEEIDALPDQTLAALAIGMMSGIVRQMRTRSVNAIHPGAIVTAPSAAWLGLGVGRATTIDCMVLGGKEGEVTPCEERWRELYADRQDLAVVGTVIGEGTDMLQALRLPDIKGRAKIAIALISEFGPLSYNGIPICSVIQG